ncbi:hypothetical protein FHS15_001440 [Paenibacillus castaneae]|nr:hypothetical protein [Paenibacillus castaneae]
MNSVIGLDISKEESHGQAFLERGKPFKQPDITKALLLSCYRNITIFTLSLIHSSQIGLGSLNFAK